MARGRWPTEAALVALHSPLSELHRVPFFVCFLACTDPATDGDTGPLDTDSDADSDSDSDADTDSDTDSDTDTDTDTDSDADTDTGTVTGTITAEGYGLDATIVYCDFIIDGHEFTTDLAGLATVAAPMDASFEASVYKSGYLRARWFLTTDASPFDTSYDLFTRVFLSALVGAFSGEYDEAAATVIVPVYQPDGVGGWEPAVGARVNLDVAYDAAIIVEGADSYTTGNRVPDGGLAYVLFTNVAVGDVSVTVTPPDGMSCSTFPSSTRFEGAIQTTADWITTLVVRCE